MVYLAHTHDGARVAMHCLWHGTPKVSQSPAYLQSGLDPEALVFLCTTLVPSCTEVSSSGAVS